MSQRMKVGGVWKALDLFLKVKGEWKKSTGVYIKVNGVWKLGRHIHTFNYVSNGVDTTHTGTCSHCGETITEGHVYTLVDVQEPTCTETGSEIYLCETCNQEKTVVIAALGHTGEGSYVAPTCTSGGSWSRTCERCGQTEYETYEPTDHSWTQYGHESATCNSPGGYYEKCTVCGNGRWVHTEDATGEHNYQPSYEDKPDGTIICTWTCTYCGDSYIE